MVEMALFLLSASSIDHSRFSHQPILIPLYRAYPLSYFSISFRYFQPPLSRLSLKYSSIRHRRLSRFIHYRSYFSLRTYINPFYLKVGLTFFGSFRSICACPAAGQRSGARTPSTKFFGRAISRNVFDDGCRRSMATIHFTGTPVGFYVISPIISYVLPSSVRIIQSYPRNFLNILREYAAVVVRITNKSRLRKRIRIRTLRAYDIYKHETIKK